MPETLEEAKPTSGQRSIMGLAYAQEICDAVNSVETFISDCDLPQRTTDVAVTLADILALEANAKQLVSRANTLKIAVTAYKAIWKENHKDD